MLCSARLSGLDLTPLPFESSLSVLWRLGWRNKLTVSTLKGVCGGSKGFPANGVFFARDWIDNEHFLGQTGWRLPTNEERQFCNTLNYKQDDWVHSRFRYCPICLGDGYHSFWHQCSGIELCPVHKIPLSNRCHHCNKLLPELRFGKPLLDQPYICSECQMPISGAPVSLDAHLHLREHQYELIRAFEPYNRWWEASVGARRRAAGLVNNWSIDINLSTWCHASAYKRDMVYFECAPPHESYSPIYRRFTQLTWRIRFCQTVEPWQVNPRRNWHQRTYIAKAIYYCTLRQLIEWIRREESPTVDEIKRHACLDIKNGKVNITGYKPKLVALCLMRTVLEETAYYAVDLFSLKDLCLQDEPRTGMTLFENRSPRLAWRALFLAYYACWYFRVLKGRRKGFLDLGEMSYSIGALVPSTIRVTDSASGHFAEGRVCFPTIDRFYESFGVQRWIRENSR